MGSMNSKIDKEINKDLIKEDLIEKIVKIEEKIDTLDEKLYIHCMKTEGKYALLSNRLNMCENNHQFLD